MSALRTDRVGYYSIEVDDDLREAPLRFHINLMVKYAATTLAIAAGVFHFGTWALAQGNATFLALKVDAAPRTAMQPAVRPRVTEKPMQMVDEDALPASGEPDSSSTWDPASLATTAAVVNLLGPIQEANANLATGRSASLVHPISMFGMLALTLWALFLGLKAKRNRLIGQEITETKAQATALAGQLKKAKLQGTAKETILALKGAAEAPLPADLQILEQIAALEQKTEDLVAERKELVAGNYRDKHFNAGSVLLALGVTSAILAPVNTYLRTEKLFPGPHLYIGAAMVTIWAVAAGLVPAMQKGNEMARKAHVALNLVNALFFVWQVGTGLEIVGKVLQFTSWP